jgi:hypothetical protein
MGKGKKAEDAKAVLFKRRYGVKPAVFEKMASILRREYAALHQKGGKPPRLTVEDKRYIALKYLREYRTMDASRRNTGCARAWSACQSNGRKTR